MNSTAAMTESVTTNVKRKRKCSILGSQLLMNKKLPEGHTRNWSRGSHWGGEGNLFLLISNICILIPHACVTIWTCEQTLTSRS